MSELESADGRLLPSITGIHHVRLPVTDVLISRDWYADVLGFEPVLDHEEEDRVVGAVLQHPSGFVIGLHVQPAQAKMLAGFVVISLCAGSKFELEQCGRRLDEANVEHSHLQAGNLGWYIDIPDPDGILAELHTSEQPAADEA
jgi:catechol 2,3-dioxygenase-like lactoylglutathione lyase family enzyme